VSTNRQAHPRAPVKQRDGDELLKLLALGGGLPDRLQAHAAAAWTRRLHAGYSNLEAALPELTAALYGRLLLATRLWLAETQLSIDMTMVDADNNRLLRRSRRHHSALRLAHRSLGARPHHRLRPVLPRRHHHRRSSLGPRYRRARPKRSHAAVNHHRISAARRCCFQIKARVPRVCAFVPPIARDPQPAQSW
jgi:hypothetical protein